jgi:replicative DNA helicase
VAMGDLLAGTLDAAENPPDDRGMRTGLRDLDEHLDPILPGQVVLLGARAGMGKTALALTLARHASLHQHRRGLFVSLEMSNPEVMRRLVAAEARVDLRRLKAGTVTEDEWGRLAKAHGTLAEGRLWLDDAPHLNLAALRGLVRAHTPEYVVVDYAQLMEPPAGKDRRVQMDELGRGLKLLAKSERVPIIVPCQLNRALEHRADKTPTLADLRETGAWEATADVVLLLHRPAVYGDQERSGEADITVAKQRDGTSGVTVAVAEQLHFGRFSDLARLDAPLRPAAEVRMAGERTEQGWYR